MAARLHKFHDARTRSKIQASQLINRLQNHALGKNKMITTQVRAAEALLRKVMPDLQATQLSGDPNQPLIHKIEQIIIDSRDPTNPRTS